MGCWLSQTTQDLTVTEGTLKALFNALTPSSVTLITWQDHSLPDKSVNSL